MFFMPIEARYIQIIPTKWRNEIAIRVSLLGCPITTTTLANEISTTLKTTVERNFILS